MAIRAKSTEIEGLDDLIKDLAAFGDAAMPLLDESSNDAGNVVLDKVKGKARKFTDTGNLVSKLVLRKATKGGRRSKKSKYKSESRVTVRRGAAYYIPLELGHNMVLFGKKTSRRVEGRPFMRPGADESKDKVAEIMAAGISKAIEKLGD